MKQFYRACLSAFTTATKIGLLFGFLLFLCTSYSQVAITCPGNITANISDNPISYTAPTLTNGAIAPATIPGYTFLGSFDSSSYYLQNSSTSAQQAYNLAVSSGYNLVSINSLAENNFIQNAMLATAISKTVIGYNDLAVEGTFVWQSGEITTYTNWTAGEPNNTGNSDYTFIFDTGLWEDTNDTNPVNAGIIEFNTGVVQIAGLPSGSNFPLGTTTNTFRAYNSNGTFADCSFTVTIVDPCTVFTSNIAYVDANATGANNGSSWADAFTDLQAAITAINDCPALDTIYIAEGTYLPTATTDQDISFEIPANTTIYGGFSPNNGAIDLGTRNFNAYPTILSGDIGVPGITNDNTDTIVIITSNTAPITFDGITIRDGFDSDFLGGDATAILIDNALGGINLTLNNCTISNNEASITDIIYTIGPSHLITINNSFITDNQSNNRAILYAAALTGVTITNTTIANNASYSTMNFEGTDAVSIENCIFENNFGELNSGIYIEDGISLIVKNTTVRNNSAGGTGGGVVFAPFNTPSRFENTLFHDNNGTNAAIYFGNNSNLNQTLDIIGCTITQNSFASGNSIFVDNLPSPGINPVTINITNTLIWDYNNTNGSPNIFSQDPANTVENFNYSLVSGYDLTANNGLDGTNLANDPQFTDPATNDFTLQPTSPVIDLGDNTVVTEPNDLNGNTRIVDGDSNTTMIVDFGAYEAPELADTTPPVITCPSDITGDCAINPITYPFPTATDNIGVTPATPAGFQYVASKNGKSYFLSDAGFDGPSAFADAIALGGTVATIVNQETNTEIQVAVEALAPGISFYIGLNDLTTEGAFEWQSTIPFAYENWLVGEPNGGASENYTVMNATNGFWVDIGAGFVARYILELTGGIEQIAGLPSGFNFPVGTTTNTFLATDTSGNTDTCSFDITITDSTPVTITCPADITTNNDPGLCGAYVDYPYPIPNEDCNQTNPLLLSQVDEIVNLGFDCVDFISSHVRIFDLAAEGVTNDYFIDTIRVGIAFANPAENVTVNIYLDDQLPNAITTYNSPLSDHVLPYATNTVASPAANATILEVPINVFIPSDATIIVEVVTPETANFLMGYLNNNASETAVGYIGCGSFFAPSDLYPAIISVDGSEYLNQTTIQTAGLSPNSLFPIGTTTNTFVVTDANGNTDTCSFNITVNDTELPVLTCPADITIDNEPLACGAVVDYTVFGSENCITSTIPGFEVIGSSNKKIYYLSDTKFLPPDAFADAVANGGFVVTIEDDIMNSFLFDRVQQMAPNATPIIGYNDIATEGNFVWQSGEPSVYNNWFTGEPNGATAENHTQLRTDGFWNDISPTAGAYRYILEIDSASLLTQTAGLAAGSEFPVGTTTNTFTYTDPFGNIGMCSFDVTVNDIEAPVAVCQDITIQLDAFGNATIVATDVDDGSTDNCAVTDYQVDIDTFTCADVGNPVTVTLTVFDDALNSDTCTAIVTVEDVTAPDITCPADQNEDFDANCEFILPDYTALATVSDSCDTNPIVTQSPIPGTTITGTTQITLSAEDASGNINTCVFDVIPEDNTAPTITCPANQTEDLDANCEFILPDYTGLATVSDSCDSNPTVTQSPIAGTVVTVTTQITLFAEDVSGNINSCVFDVILQDTTAPTITCPPTQNETPDASCMFTLPDYTGLATAIDNCGTVSITQTPAPGTVVGIGNTTITLEASDGTNLSSCMFDVVVSDTSAPTITCPADQNVDYDSSCQFTLQDYTGLATTTDACDPAPIISQNPPAGTVISATTTITLTTTDASGNSDFCTFDVIPTDATPPSLNCPADQNEILDANCEFVVPDYTSLAFVIDNCDPNPLLSQSPIPGTIIATTTVITIFAEDSNGNTDSCTFTVTLEDTTPPVITCPPTQNETADANCMFTLPDYTGLATATDNCGTVSITQTPPPGTMVGSGNTSITLEASDGINTSNCTFTVIVADTTPPTAVCQDITVQLDASGMAIINAFDIDNGSSDNCSIASSSVSPNTFSCADVGTPQTVTLTVTDASGNTSTCTSMITVEDVLPPTAICQDITLILDASGNATLIPSDIDGGSSDNCGIASLSASQTAFTCDDIGPNDVILTITDDSGNTSSCTAIVTVSEAIDPIAVCQDITVQLDATGTVTILPADVDGGSSDNCGIDTLSLDTDTFTCADVGPNMVTLTVFDTSGNSSSCMAIVTVEDNVVPEAICQDITVILDANAMATIVASDVDGGSTDACGIALLEIDIDTFTCDDVGPNNVTLTVTDVNGNMSSCVAVVNIEEENITPIAVCQNVTVPLGIDGTATIPASSIDAGSTGASCSGGLSLDIDTFDCSDVGKPVTVTLTVTNGNGVTDSCTAVVNVVDTLDPTITCPDDQVVQSDGLYTLPDYVANGLVVYQDNCGPLTTVQQEPAPGTMLDLGEYLINFTATDPSGNEIDCFFRLTIEELLGTNTTVSLETVTLFPNPASEFIVIANPARIELQEVAIYDMTGRLVQNLAVNNAAETVVPISHLASASYMVLITSETQQLTKQLVKE
ncbi:MAG TPA: HYR domain-containing protein [Flavobacteriaceae bacterium]|nr:HYR domain-containing protein [Flavobacteriaceae bacterium]HIN98235.1 HYR domain-containing protein [Flavobacteriaceae bacterium]